ncbi:hypothetical protein ABGB12_13260 [Actinocorallia sp. B10E7]|uniref:hypothetical protein n=1 Tax=Actinocorallia sp. B10E7 TaxID=3153558 RepID=UPI00325CA8C4
MCQDSGLPRKWHSRRHRPAPWGSRTGSTISPRLSSGPPVNTTANGPSCSHHNPLPPRPAAGRGAGMRRGWASTRAPGSSRAACSGDVTSEGRAGWR